MSKFTCSNPKDTGSLKVGTSAGSHKWEPGQVIRLAGEDKLRKISYVMGNGEKTHVVAKGTGPFPTGDAIQYEIVQAEQPATAE